jgi:hypothetical protein
MVSAPPALDRQVGRPVAPPASPTADDGHTVADGDTASGAGAVDRKRPAVQVRCAVDLPQQLAEALTRDPLTFKARIGAVIDAGAQVKGSSSVGADCKDALSTDSQSKGRSGP